jgi:hypothetical protein
MRSPRELLDSVRTRVPSLPAPWDRRLAAAGWFCAAILALLWVLLLGSILLGISIGEPGPDQDPVTVSADASPAELAAAGMTNVHRESVTVEQWRRVRDYSDGSAEGGIVAHLRVDRAAQRMRGRVWVSTLRLYTGYRDPANHTVEVFATRGTGWQRFETPPGNSWQRSDNYLTQYEPEYPSVFAYDLDNASYVVHSESDASITMEAKRAASLTGRTPAKVNATVTLTVAKRPEPHLRQVTVTYREPREARTDAWRFYDYGTTAVSRPAELGPTTLSELLYRAGSNLASWAESGG